MKGQMEEILYFTIIIFAILILFTFFAYQTGTKGAEVRKTVEERITKEEVFSALNNLFSEKLPISEKYYLIMAIDGILGGEDYDFVYYGKEIGGFNLTSILTQYIDKLIKDRWRLEIITPDGIQVYGKLPIEKVVYSWENWIPVPYLRIGKVVFSIG